MKNKLIILIGVDGMGKTTYANSIKNSAYKKGNDYIGKEQEFLDELIRFEKIPANQGMIQVLDRVISIDKFVYGNDVKIDNGPHHLDNAINDQIKYLIKRNKCKLILFVPDTVYDIAELTDRLMSRGDEFIDVSNKEKTRQFIIKMHGKYIRTLNDLGFDGLYERKGLVRRYEK